jgi:hypothetical protein
MDPICCFVFDGIYVCLMVLAARVPRVQAAAMHGRVHPQVKDKSMVVTVKVMSVACQS